MRARTLLLAALLAALVAGPAAAEPKRGGFWISAGGGYVDAKVDCDGCEDVHYEPSSGATLAAGGTISEHVRLGIEVFGLWRDVDDREARQWTTLLNARWNPSVNSGFQLRTGFGLAVARVDYPIGGGTVRENQTGSALAFGLGWELPVGPVLLTPSAVMHVGALGDILIGDVVYQDGLTTAYLIGVDVTLP